MDCVKEVGEVDIATIMLAMSGRSGTPNANLALLSILRL